MSGNDKNCGACADQGATTAQPAENCPGRTPLFENWCKENAPYPGGSITWDECGFYMLPCGPEWAPPRSVGSKWVPFSGADFIRAIQNAMHPECSFTFDSSGDNDNHCMPGYKRVWALGEIRCHNGYLHCNMKSDNAADPMPDGAAGNDWSRGMTREQLICKLIDIEDTNTQITVVSVEGEGDTITITMSDGSVVTGPREDIYVTSFDDSDPDSTTVTLNDGTTITSVETGDGDVFLQSKTEVTNADGSVTHTFTMSDGTVYTVQTSAPSADSVLTGFEIVGDTVEAARSNGLPNLALPCYTNYSAWVDSNQNPGQTVAGDLPRTADIETNDTTGRVFEQTANGLRVLKAGWYDLHHFSQFQYEDNRGSASGQATARHDVYKTVGGVNTNLNTILQNPDWQSDGPDPDDLHSQTYFRHVFIEAGAEVKQKISAFPAGGNLNPAFLDARRNRFRLTSMIAYPIPCPN